MSAKAPAKGDDDASAEETKQGEHDSHAGDDEPTSKEEDSDVKDEDQAWEDAFNRLVEFKSREGHCLVPFRYKQDRHLGKWVAAQRKVHQRVADSGKKTPAEIEHRFRRLDEIGFEWTAKDPRHVPWSHRYQEIVDFVRRFGHAQVPIGWKENPQLSNWVSVQRQEYRALLKGKPSRLTNDRVRQLTEVDFIFEARRGGPKRHASATESVPSKPTPAKGSEKRHVSLLETIEQPKSAARSETCAAGAGNSSRQHKESIYMPSPPLHDQSLANYDSSRLRESDSSLFRLPSSDISAGFASHQLQQYPSDAQSNQMLARLIMQARNVSSHEPGVAASMSPLAALVSTYAGISPGLSGNTELEALAQLTSLRRISNTETTVHRLADGLDTTLHAPRQPEAVPVAQASLRSGESNPVPLTSLQDQRMLSIIPLATPSHVDDAGYQYALVPRSMLQDLREQNPNRTERDVPQPFPEPDRNR